MINGFLYEKNSSIKYEAILLPENKSYILKSNGEFLEKGAISSLKISKRLGNTPREIILSNEKKFITNNNDLVDMYLLQKREFLHLLESRFRFIIISLLLSVALMFLFIKYAIPFFSGKIANKIPLEITDKVSISTIDFLDKYILKESKIDSFKQKEIQKVFDEEMLNSLSNSEFEYRLLIRDFEQNKRQIANAFALPNGIIIVTDELIKLTENINELKSIIFHEIAHIEKRDSLKLMIENSFIAVIVAIYLGDISFLGDLGVGIGTFMINSSYSRKHETQADIYSFEKMIETGIDPIYFIKIMEKIENQYPKDENNNLFYLSTHPPN